MEDETDDDNEHVWALVGPGQGHWALAAPALQPISDNQVSSFLLSSVVIRINFPELLFIPSRTMQSFKTDSELIAVP